MEVEPCSISMPVTIEIPLLRSAFAELAARSSKNAITRSCQFNHSKALEFENLLRSFCSAALILVALVAFRSSKPCK